MNKVESALQRTTDTKALVIGVGTLPRTAEMFNELFPGCRAVVVADTNTWRVAGGEVHRILADAGIGQDEPHVFADPKLYAEWSFVEELDGVLAATDAVPVAVGSGVINDLTKLCSHHNGRRYMVVGTAASMDGPCSAISDADLLSVADATSKNERNMANEQAKVTKQKLVQLMCEA